ncbi:MAG TPA: GNAT family N-acetyltransferase [Acidimicrobiales bacterium]|nr:GNAT family N-acetyltransferase [Acidimicrobiales bacterium]
MTPQQTASYWPLFGLRLHALRLVLRPPTDDDFPGLIAAADARIHDPETMPFMTPWTDDAPEVRSRKSAQHWWKPRADWCSENWHLPLATFLDGQPVGVQSLWGKGFKVLREVRTGSWLTRGAQGQGYGREMRAAVLQLAFEGLGAEVARSEAFADNASSIGISHALGYRENGSSRAAPRGNARLVTHFELTRDRWLTLRDQFPSAEIAGLEACLHMFGL